MCIGPLAELWHEKAKQLVARRMDFILLAVAAMARCNDACVGNDARRPESGATANRGQRCELFNHACRHPRQDARHEEGKPEAAQ